MPPVPPAVCGRLKKFAANALQPSLLPSANVGLWMSGRLVNGVVGSGAEPGMIARLVVFAGGEPGPVRSKSKLGIEPGVVAATVATHGSSFSVVEAPGPELPAAAAMKMPAFCAPRKASELASSHGPGDGPPIE